MTDVLISSSALILILCVIRRLFKGRIRAKLQYALWGLVALRLLLPFSLDPFISLVSDEPILASPYSVLSVAQEFKEQTIDGTTLQSLVDNVTKGHVYHIPEADSALIKAASVDWELVIMIVWMIGAVFMAGVMHRNYYKFAKMLSKNRKQIRTGAGKDCRYPVYAAEGLKSPCLAIVGGKEGIYVTPEVANDEQRLRHVIVHEEVHGLHKDLRWTSLRNMLLCAYWINPLVWLAAVLCKRDCELACDEAAVELLGEEERFAYGRTLVSLIACKTFPWDMLDMATTMTAGKRSIKERIQMLSARRKGVVLATIVVILVAAAAVVFTFAGKEESDDSDFYQYKNDAEDPDKNESDNAAESMQGMSENAQSTPESEGTPVEPGPLKYSPDMIIGADGAILDYASQERVIFHGYFGLFVFDMRQGMLVQGLDLGSIGCGDTQGSNACDVKVSKDGSIVYLKPMAQEFSYIYHVNSNELIKIEDSSSVRYVELYEGAEPLTAEVQASMGAVGPNRAQMENGCYVYITWQLKPDQEITLEDIRITTDEGMYGPMFRAPEPPKADISVNETLLVPNSGYYVEYAGKTYSPDNMYDTFVTLQAYRKAYKGDEVFVRLDEEMLGDLTIADAEVYDYWIDNKGEIKTWNRFEYEPLKDVEITSNEIRFTMTINMAQSLSSHYDPNGFLRGMAANITFSDGNQAAYYFVLHSPGPGIDE